MGKSDPHDDLFRSVRVLCEKSVGARSIFRLLAEQGHVLFPDEMFADLYSSRGRRSVAPRVMATVMVLQRFEGLSDADAADRLRFDLRYKWACGLPYDAPSFDPTLFVDMRARLRQSKRPDRIFEAVLDVAKKAGLVGKKRIVDSTALYDAVATQDTVTLVRSAIVALLRIVPEETRQAFRALLQRDDPYDKTGKPACAWDDEKARIELVDALTRDAHALLGAIDERPLDADATKAAALLATVVGQDIAESEDGVFRIIRGVAHDRVISTVDPEARHGHKTEARSFDGYKGHVVIDADSEIITALDVTAASASDATVAESLLADVLTTTSDDTTKPQVYGDSSYGTADLVEKLEAAGVEPLVKVQPPPSRDGMFSQEAFEIDLQTGEARCPAGVRVSLRVLPDGSQHARFADACAGCALKDKCTRSKSGRLLHVHRKHDVLRRHRDLQRDEGWKMRYRATRPKIERKIAHLMRRKHGGRRARLRGRARVKSDFALLGASINLARLAALGIRDLSRLVQS